jgi:hypothetical protein
MAVSKFITIIIIIMEYYQDKGPNIVIVVRYKSYFRSLLQLVNGFNERLRIGSQDERCHQTYIYVGQNENGQAPCPNDKQNWDLF